MAFRGEEQVELLSSCISVSHQPTRSPQDEEEEEEEEEEKDDDEDDDDNNE